MKHFAAIALACCLPLFMFSQGKPQFKNFVQGDIEADAFTTTNFTAIAVGKGNTIWAGTQYGGLYMYSDSFKVWRKSDKLTNIFINDIKADPDSGIWIAQSGIQSPGNNSNIAGGVNYFRVASDISMEFYSVAGTTTGANLLSRNVRSLYLDPAYKDALGRLPRPWVAQGTFITSMKTKPGGLSIGLNPFESYFDNIQDGYASGPNATPISEAIGGDNNEVWVAVRQNNGKSQLLRYTADGKYVGAYTGGDTTTKLLPNGFSAQAIYVDANGNRWVGLKSGGLVIKTPSGWVKMDTESKIPPGTQINYNAIAGDEYGNVYIGTSSGLLEYLSPDYHSFSAPDNPNSYNLYTDIDGLPSNNITGIAYDKKNGRVLITSRGGGVTFMNRREPYIKGVVYDVFTSIDSVNAYAGLQKKPLMNGVTVRLLEDGVEKDFAFPDATGVFELKEAQDNKSYTVEVSFKKDGKEMKYLYKDVRNHTLMLPTLMPDSLIREIKAFKPKMEKRCFEFGLPFGIKIEGACRDGFDVTGYDLAYEPFYEAGGITEDHKKKVDNLADYFAAIKTVYSLGGSATDMSNDVLANSIAAIESLKAFGKVSFTVQDKVKKEGDPFEELGVDLENISKALVTTVKLMKDGFVVIMNKVASQLTSYPAAKAILERSATVFNDAADITISLLSEGGDAARKALIIDHIKKFISAEAAATFYKNYYCLDKHKNFVYQSSNASKYGTSEFTYPETFDNLYNPTANSLVKYAKDTLDHRKAGIEKLAFIAKTIETTSTLLDGASALALIPGGQIAGAIAKALSTAAKFANTTALGGAVYLGAMGTYEIVDLSGNISAKSGLLRNAHGLPYNRPMAPPSQSLPVALTASKNSYNQKLTELQLKYNEPGFSPAAFGSSYRAFLAADSAYSKEMTNTLNALWASADSAIMLVPGFEPQLYRVVDSFISVQYNRRNALFYQNLAFISESDRSPYVAELNALVTEIKTLNDSAINGLTRLITTINDNGIMAPAILVQDDYSLQHDHTPGTAGSFTYTLKNYGNEPQQGVSFKISQPTAGFTLTSADSIYIGTILPKESKQITFHFMAPTQDTIGRYNIAVHADNGKFNNISGSLYTNAGDGTLPITLGNFSTTCGTTGAILNWQTASEINSHQFEIEKSPDGVSWKTAGTKVAAGTSNATRKYSYNDAAGGDAFYRLKMVDKDGRFTYSAVRQSRCDIKRNSLSIYPVPTKNTLNVVIESGGNGKATIVLMDAIGRSLKQVSTGLVTGSNKITMTVEGIAPGQYFIKVTGANINQSRPVTITR